MRVHGQQGKGTCVVDDEDEDTEDTEDEHGRCDIAELYDRQEPLFAAMADARFIPSWVRAMDEMDRP